MAVVLTPTVQYLFNVFLPIFLPFTSRVVRGSLGAYRAELSKHGSIPEITHEYHIKTSCEDWFLGADTALNDVTILPAIARGL